MAAFPPDPGLGRAELPLLLQLQQFFGGVGTISKSSNYNRVIYSVSSIKDLTNNIIPLPPLVSASRFLKLPSPLPLTTVRAWGLLTQKAADFFLFKEVVDLMNKKAHLSTLASSWLETGQRLKEFIKFLI